MATWGIEALGWTFNHFFTVKEKVSRKVEIWLVGCSGASGWWWVWFWLTLVLGVGWRAMEAC